MKFIRPLNPFRLVYYDDLNGYYKMSPIGFDTEEKAVDAMHKSQSTKNPAWGVVRIEWGVE